MYLFRFLSHFHSFSFVSLPSMALLEQGHPLPRWDVEGPQELGAGSQLLFFYDGLRVSLTDSCSAVDSFLLFLSTDTCVGSPVVVLVSEFLRASFVSETSGCWMVPTLLPQLLFFSGRLLFNASLSFGLPGRHSLHCHLSGFADVCNVAETSPLLAGGLSFTTEPSLCPPGCYRFYCHLIGFTDDPV